MNNKKGFSVIELLVVIAIIGVLSTIAMPQYAEYKRRAYDSVAKSNIRDLVTSQEVYYLENSKYAAEPEELTTFKQQNGVKINLEIVPGTDSQYWTATVNHTLGTSNKKFCYNSLYDMSIRETGC